MTEIGRAVQERRASKAYEDTEEAVQAFAERMHVPVSDARELLKLYRSLEFFPTPPWASRAGAALIKRIDPAANSAWEPACGKGHMAEPLREYFAEVRASDCHAYGYGEVKDFLFEFGPPCVDWIITNPPFELAVQFALHGFTRARRGVALLLRTAWLESVERYSLFYESSWPLTVLAPYAERVNMQLGYWSPNGSTATAYAWFIFQPSSVRESPRIVPIPPGQRERLAKGDDVRRFGPPVGPPAPAPLFDGR